MQRGTVVNLKHFKIGFDFLRQNWKLILLTLCFIVGIILATFSTNKSGYIFKQLKLASQNFIELRLSKDFLKIFLKSFLIDFVFLLAIFVLGSSINGITLVPVIIGIKGYLLGNLIGYIYSAYELKGIAFCALIVIPPSIITVICLFNFSKFAMCFSLRVISVTMPNTLNKNLNLQFKQFVKLLFINLLPIIFSALCDGWLSMKLVPYLKF